MEGQREPLRLHCREINRILYFAGAGMSLLYHTTRADDYVKEL